MILFLFFRQALADISQKRIGFSGLLPARQPAEPYPGYGDIRIKIS
jgi:hypothetical protein